MRARLGPVFWWLWAGSLLSALAMFVAPFLAMYLSSRGLRPSAVGLVASCYGVGAVLAGPAAGVVADALGRRRTLVVALAVAGAAAAALAFVRSPVTIAAVVLAYGGAMAASRPPMRAIVADVVAPGDLSRAFGWIYWAENLGASFSLLAGGLLATAGFTVPFLADAVTTLGFAAVVLLRVPETRPGEATASADGPGYGIVLRDRRLLSLLALIFVVQLAYGQTMVSLPVDMVRQGYGPATFGAVGALSGLLVVLLQPFSARALEPLAPPRVLCWGGTLIALGVGAYALCRTPGQYAAASALWTLGEIAFFATAAATVSALAPAEGRGRYMGAYGFCLSLGAIAAPAIGPAVLEAFGREALWLSCAALGGSAAIGFLAWGFTRSEDRGAPSASAPAPRRAWPSGTRS